MFLVSEHWDAILMSCPYVLKTILFSIRAEQSIQETQFKKLLSFGFKKDKFQEFLAMW